MAQRRKRYTQRTLNLQADGIERVLQRHKAAGRVKGEP